MLSQISLQNWSRLLLSLALINCDTSWGGCNWRKSSKGEPGFAALNAAISVERSTRQLSASKQTDLNWKTSSPKWWHRQNNSGNPRPKMIFYKPIWTSSEYQTMIALKEVIWGQKIMKCWLTLTQTCWYAEKRVPCTYEICHIMLLQVPDAVILLWISMSTTSFCKINFQRQLCDLDIKYICIKIINKCERTDGEYLGLYSSVYKCVILNT